MIKLYTIDCPQCLVLEKKLSLKGIQFETIKDKELMQQMGIDAVPILEVNGEKMDFTNAVKWVNEQ